MVVLWHWLPQSSPLSEILFLLSLYPPALDYDFIVDGNIGGFEDHFRKDYWVLYIFTYFRGKFISHWEEKTFWDLGLGLGYMLSLSL